ncbi:hypothetical protein [Cellulomonas phragmiteti]|nr:hypothetical protein [Cellulomonas phragmiteti]
MREQDRARRATHPADPALPEQRGAADVGDDVWGSARTEAPHTVVPAAGEVRSWAWEVDA